MTFHVIFFTATLLVAAGIGETKEVPVRLAEGATRHEGRVEVFHEGEWGTACSDFFGGDNNACNVVCNQLGFRGGVVRPKQFPAGSGRIWLDDVECSGDEAHLGECRMNHWGQHNCAHTEDVGCECHVTTSTEPNVTCIQNRHRIQPFDVSNPAIGRAEIQDSLGIWKAICDDDWDDTDAAVFCNCLGYSRPQYFRAFWTPSLASMEPSIEIGYSSIQCTSTDKLATRNLWECNHQLGDGLCKGSHEAAGVTCDAVPATKQIDPPVLSVSCDGQVLSVCLSSDKFNLTADHLYVQPRCAAVLPKSTNDSVCVDIKMESCQAAMQQIVTSYKHYCYDILYSPSEISSNVLITRNIWMRRACCSLATTGSVAAVLEPEIPKGNEGYAHTLAAFRLECFITSDFSGVALRDGANVSHGQAVFCRVQADTWDDHMNLVVPNCQFSVGPDIPPIFVFHKNKCPSTDDLGLSYFNFDRHKWGFRFLMPKFQGHDTIHLSCEAYLCDGRTEEKPYCDRTCLNRRRRRETITTYSADDNMRTNLLADKKGASAEVGENFKVSNKGLGPVITIDGSLLSTEAKDDSQEVDVISRSSTGSFLTSNIFVFLAVILFIIS